MDFVLYMMFLLIVLTALVGIQNRRIRIDKYIIENAWFIKKKPLTEIEQIAYWKIIEALKNEKIVLAQVAFNSMMKAEGRTKNGLWMNVKGNIADFVICNKDFSIHAIIEIDDKTHNKAKDNFRDEVTNKAGIKTIRYMARELPSIDKLREDLL